LSEAKFSGKIIEIRVPAGKGLGAYVESLSEAPHEKEFLLQRGNTYKVIANNGDENIVLEVING
jgi:hypothetical protein